MRRELRRALRCRAGTAPAEPAGATAQLRPASRRRSATGPEDRVLDGHRTRSIVEAVKARKLVFSGSLRGYSQELPNIINFRNCPLAAENHQQPRLAGTARLFGARVCRAPNSLMRATRVGHCGRLGAGSRRWMSALTVPPPMLPVVYLRRR
jgi:hypothetical protein